MPAYIFPQHIRLGTMRGRVIPARGLIRNVHLENNPFEPFSPTLAWSHDRIDVGQPTSAAVVKVYRDGEPEHVIREARRVPVSSLTSGNQIQYEVEARTEFDVQAFDNSAAFAVNLFGDRAEITWTEATAPDFESYKLYWDQGGGATALVKELKGRKNTRWISSQLTDGTAYKFALSMTDAAGNESAQGTVSEITADLVPLSLQGATISYNSGTRVATIGGQHPANQHSDIGLVALYDNYWPSVGLSEYPNVEYENRRDVIYATSQSAYATIDSHELWPGQWKFALRAVDEMGNQSTYQTFTLNIIGDGTRGSAIPLIPQNLFAEAVAGGSIQVTWDHAGADVSKYELYQGATLDQTITSNIGTTPHTAIATALTDATQYTYSMKACNGGVCSATSDTATATADSTAPTNAKALTIGFYR